MFWKKNQWLLGCLVALTGVCIGMSNSSADTQMTNDTQNTNLLNQNVSELQSLTSVSSSADDQHTSGEYVDDKVPTFHFKWQVSNNVLTILSGHLGVPAGGVDDQFHPYSISKLDNGYYSSHHNNSKLAKVIIAKGVTTDQSLDGLFANLNTDEIDLSNLDTSDVTDMAYMFYSDNTQVTGLDKLDYSHVTSMEGMFSNWEPTGNYIANDANILANSNVLNKMLAQIDVSHVKNFSYMLATDQYYIDISSWNMSGVTNDGEATTKNMFGITLWDRIYNTPAVIKLGPGDKFNSPQTFMMVNGSSGIIELADEKGYAVNGVEQPQLVTTTPNDGKTPLQYQLVGNGNVFNPEGNKSLDLATLYSHSSSSVPQQPETYVVSHKPFKGILMVSPAAVTLNYKDQFDPEKYLYGDYTLYHSIDSTGRWLTNKDITVTPTIDTSVPGTYNLTYSYEGQTAKQTVVVKPNPFQWQLKDLTLNLGDNYTPKDGFISLTIQNTDISGKPVTDVYDGRYFDELIKAGIMTITETPKVDTAKAGVYKVTYAIPQMTSQTATVTVKDQSALELKDVSLNQGEKFDPATAFVSAIGPDGTKYAKYNDAVKAGMKIDTSKLNNAKPGTYPVTYRLGETQKTISVKVIAQSKPIHTDNSSATGTIVSRNTTGVNNDSSVKSIPDQQKAQSATADQAKSEFKVYAKKTVYRYQNVNFKKNQRIKKYRQRVRIYAPIFHVVGTQKSTNGNLRYVLSDGSFITAKATYVAPLYWQGNYHKLYVINPKGTYEYKSTRFMHLNRVKHFKQGTVLNVKKVVHSGLTTRFKLTNGHYISGNKQWTAINRPNVPKRVLVKHNLYLYRDVNLHHKESLIKTHHVLRVVKWDYAHGNSLRYKVAGGYITANSHYVKPIK
ncbi:hypothetical protein YK48G_22460 [Lentilactobacillus fungorum]|uniref:BspA family leucine-rich repeat surface protein n=1 Tax=Lentilactobacillus fungorum TaxID=2201250 RepID=A0ABQ3W374_9LACO|nr:DUF5776 domain-containing protein [Lentilactobacillus fungorum]GHP14821.1 hypothetical protein YK48G_22460 [Lentilactobacillus fungorum]